MIKKIIFLLTLFIFFLPFGFLFWWQEQTQPLDSIKKETQLFIIPKGWGVEKIGNHLKQEGLIRDVLVFKLMVYKEGVAQKLQAGDFKLSPSMNLFEIVQSLTHGSVDIWVTIPEGLRKEEIALIIKKAFQKKGLIFDNNAFLEQIEEKGVFIFPDTYLIPKNAEVQQIIKILSKNFEGKYASLKINSTMTKKQIIILASLVEREAKYDKDRPIIAGILLNRLKKGWPLQVDATVQYAKTNLNKKTAENKKIVNWWPVINKQDIEKINSQYNTYKNIGLPPGAICVPGLASLQAAASPQQSNYWFYISDNFGKIHYSKNLKEHNRNISKYLTD